MVIPAVDIGDLETGTPPPPSRNTALQPFLWRIWGRCGMYTGSLGMEPVTWVFVVHVVVDREPEVGLARRVPGVGVHLARVVGETGEVEGVVRLVVLAHLGGRLGVLLVDDAAPAEGDAVVHVVDVVAVLGAAGLCSSRRIRRGRRCRRRGCRRGQRRVAGGCAGGGISAGRGKGGGRTATAGWGDPGAGSAARRSRSRGACTLSSSRRTSGARCRSSGCWPGT